MQKFFLLFVTVSALSFTSCKKGGDEEGRKIENEKIGEFLNDSKVQFYKAMKIALRYSASAEKDPEIEKARLTLMKLGGHSLSLGMQAADSAQTVNPMELLSLAGEAYKAKDILNKTEEDSLPTILGNICYFSGGMKSCDVPDMGEFKYDNNLEHAVIGLLWFASVKGPKEFSFYELHKTNENDFKYYDLAILSKLTKSVIYYEHKFPYNGMDRATEALALIEKNREKIIANPLFSFTDGEMNGEKTYYQMHGLGSVLKGLNEKDLEKEEEAMKDFEIFLADAEKGGLDNELTWLIGSYVYIKKEEKDKALSYLVKLEQSTMLDEPEQKAIAEIKTYLANRDNGKALTALNDKFAYGSIAFNLIKRRIEKTRAIAGIENTAEGRRFRELHRELDDKAAYLDMLNKGMSADSLTEKASDLVKGLFK